MYATQFSWVSFKRTRICSVRTGRRDEFPVQQFVNFKWYRNAENEKTRSESG